MFVTCNCALVTHAPFPCDCVLVARYNSNNNETLLTHRQI